jgi:translation initiation factor 6
VNKKIYDKISDILQVPMYKVKMAETNFVGLFAAGNSNGVILPDIIDEKIELNVPVVKIKTKNTCLGNLILANDRGAVISPLLSNHSSKIRDILDVEVLTGTISELPTIGSLAVATNHGVLAHPKINEEEKSLIEDLLKVEVLTGTMNGGSPFVGNCILANSNGAVVGGLTTPPELVEVEEALG